jgi:hydrogenase expression/formation protein HypC
MCLAIPGKVVKISGKKAQVQFQDHAHEVDLSLVKDARIGDYLIIHKDMALNKIPADEALRILVMIKTTSHHHEKPT